MFTVIHQLSFDSGRDLVVTSTMISIGACYSEFSGAEPFSIALSGLIRSLLIFMAEQDCRFVRTRSYLTAQLLQGTYSFYRGSERLFELGEFYCSTLVYHAKCMGLFYFEAQKLPQIDLMFEDVWCEWIEVESLRRLGWVMYKYDSSVAYCTIASCF